MLISITFQPSCNLISRHLGGVLFGTMNSIFHDFFLKLAQWFVQQIIKSVLEFHFGKNMVPNYFPNVSGNNQDIKNRNSMLNITD